MSDRDAPIEPRQFLGGVTVVDIGDLRVARGLSRRPYSGCNHLKLVYDGQERRIWCSDCEKNIEAFDAFELLVSRFSSATAELGRNRMELDEAILANIRSIAARNLDKAWRSRTMVPACPHCGSGLFPDDFRHGHSSLGIEYARAIAARRKKQAPP